MAHAEAEVKRAYNDCPSYDALIPALIEHGLDDLTERCTFQPGLPGEAGNLEWGSRRVAR